MSDIVGLWVIYLVNMENDIVIKSLFMLEIKVI